VAAVGYATTPGQLLNESHWNEDGRNPYFQAKLQSEQETARLAAELGVPTIRFCPGHAIGPYDYRITPSSERILEVINSGMWFEGGSG
jgi:nucleoside-diphosphate-sugar epimerase